MFAIGLAVPGKVKLVFVSYFQSSGSARKGIDDYVLRPSLEAKAR